MAFGNPMCSTRSPCRCPISRAPTLNEYSPRDPGSPWTPGQVSTSSAIVVIPGIVAPTMPGIQASLVLGPVGQRLARAIVGGAQHRVADLRGAVAVLEGRAVRPDLRVLADRREEVVDLVDERVLPADHVPLRPPVLPEGMVGLGHEHGAEALGELAGRGVAVVDLELVQALDVKAQGPLGAGDLERDPVLAARGEARSLDRAHGAVGEVHDRLDGVVDGDGLAFAVLDERPRVRAHRVDLADQVAGE